MPDEEPIEVVSANPLAKAFGAAGVAAAAGVIVALALASSIAASLDVGTYAGGAVAFLGTVVVVVGLSVLAGVGREARFYDDRVELASGLNEDDDRSARYDDLELVVRRSTTADGVLGTATFEALHRGGSNLELRHLRDSGVAERAFAERVAPPEEQLAEADDDRGGHFWYHWPVETDPPEEAVVEQGELEGILDVDLDGVDLDAIDEAGDVDDFEDLGDLGDVAGDIGGSGADAGGGDFGGGGGADF